MLVPLGHMSLVEALRPRVTEGGGANELGLRLERNTALGLRLFEVLDAGEMAVDEWRVDEWRIGERPQMFGWLKLWRIGGQEVEKHVVGHT
jgi:hypothetical protein